MMRILFLHGWQSVPGGVKPTFLAQHGHEVVNPALPDEDFNEAVRIAQAEFDKHQPDVVVGSSRGGAVAININSGDARLVLLCPAWRKFGTAKTVKPGTLILHSGADDVVPFADSEELVRNSGVPASALIEVGTDHRLADPEPLANMLKACEITFTCEETLSLAPDDIARQILDLTKWPDFHGYGPIPGIKVAEFEVQTPCIIGTRIRVTNLDGSSHVEEILEWQPDHRLRLEMKEFSPPLSRLATRFEETWEFKRTEKGTNVTRSFHLEAKSFLARLLLRVISFFLKRAIARHLREMRTSGVAGHSTVLKGGRQT
jgi:hypothetical protein